MTVCPNNTAVLDCLHGEGILLLGMYSGVTAASQTRLKESRYQSAQSITYKTLNNGNPYCSLTMPKLLLLFLSPMLRHIHEGKHDREAEVYEEQLRALEREMEAIDDEARDDAHCRCRDQG